MPLLRSFPEIADLADLREIHNEFLSRLRPYTGIRVRNIYHAALESERHFHYGMYK